MNRKISVLWLLFFLLFFTLEIEAKRSFSIRTRSKSTGTQYNSRRKSNRDGSDGIGSPGTVGSSGNTGSSNGHGSNSHSAPSGSSSHSVGSNVHSDHALSNSGRLEREAVIGKQTSGINSKATGTNAGDPANQRRVGWDVNNNQNKKPPVGAPPPYPGLGGSSNTFNQHPPSYYQSMGNPPTYAASQAHYGVGNTYGYPNTGAQGQGAPSFTGAGYSGVNGLGSTSLNGPGYNGGSIAGGLANQYPNNHGGIGTGGFNNGNGMSAYGSNYGYQKPGLFSTGNILTGLATWQVARALTPSRHHSHVHNNYYTNNGTQAVAEPNQNPISDTISSTTTTTQMPERGQVAPTQSIKLPVPVH